MTEESKKNTGPGSFIANIRANEARECSVGWCDKNRYRISKYCAHHHRRDNLWGHPLAEVVKLEEIEYYLLITSELFELNPNHPGIQHAVDRFQQLVNQAKTKSNPNIKYPQFFQRLDGCNLRDCLKVVAAYYLAYVAKDARIKSEKHMLFLAGNYVIRFRPLNSAIQGAHRLHTAKLLMQEFLPLFDTIAKFGMKRIEMKEQAVDSFKQPLKFEGRII